MKKPDLKILQIFVALFLIAGIILMGAFGFGVAENQAANGTAQVSSGKNCVMGCTADFFIEFHLGLIEKLSHSLPQYINFFTLFFLLSFLWLTKLIEKTGMDDTATPTGLRQKIPDVLYFIGSRISHWLLTLQKRDPLRAIRSAAV